MKTYMIGYDLDRPGQDYPELIEAIKNYGWWWHHLDSTWIIRTDSSAAQIRDYLQQFIDPNDELLVARLSGEAAWRGIPERGSKWLRDNLKG